MNPAYRRFRTDLEQALSHISERRSITDHAVHDVRKSLKKARADLRLLRGCVDEDVFHQRNDSLRDAGRCFRRQRDARSLLDTFDALRQRYVEELNGVNVSGFHKHLRARWSEAFDELQDAPGRVRDCAGKIKQTLSRAEHDGFVHAGRKSLVAGLNRLYRQGRKAFTEADHARSAEALHEWRKKVKYLLNAALGIRANTKAKSLKNADRLARGLGDIHDLTVLGAEISNADLTIIDDSAKKKLSASISDRIAMLQGHAFQLGAKLYRQKPKKFVAKLV